MNPANSGAYSNKVRQAMTKLDWMVNVNLFDNETGSFWRGPGIDPTKVKTEVFMLPCASSVEKEGSIANSGRWMQWRYKAVESRRHSRPDSDIMAELYFRLKALYEKEGGPNKEAFTKLSWNYGKKTQGALSSRCPRHRQGDQRHLPRGQGDRESQQEGRDQGVQEGTAGPQLRLPPGRRLHLFGRLGLLRLLTDRGNMSARRGKDAPGIGLFSQWAWSWPVNRRIIYNGASVDPEGQALEPRRVPSSSGMGEWAGDVPDGVGDPGIGKTAFHHET